MSGGVWNRWFFIGPVLVAGLVAVVYWAGMKGGRWHVDSPMPLSSGSLQSGSSDAPPFTPQEVLIQMEFRTNRHEDPDEVLARLAIAPGSVVADVGAGSGVYTTDFGRLVGPEGKVLASELSPLFLGTIAHRYDDAREDHEMGDLELIWATRSQCCLGQDTADLIFLSHLDRFLLPGMDEGQPAPEADRKLARCIADAVKDGGRVAILQWLFMEEEGRQVPEDELVQRIQTYMAEVGLSPVATYWPLPAGETLPAGAGLHQCSRTEWYDTALLIFSKDDGRGQEAIGLLSADRITAAASPSR